MWYVKRDAGSRREVHSFLLHVLRLTYSGNRMEQTQQIKMLQMSYAGVLADAVAQYDKEGVLEKVTERKRQQQMAAGAMLARQFGASEPQEVFHRLVEVFGCANWQITPHEEGFSAEATGCTLCAMAKNMQGASPCAIYCLNPMEAMIKGLAPDAEFEVEATLWEGAKCRVRVNSAEPERK
jgi:hypothetical protein